MVKVELIYPAIDGIFQCELQLAEGSTVEDAIKHSNLLHTHPEVKSLSLGIFSKIVTLDTLLKTGDRIEIYRPLTTDPKDKRRLRAKSRKNKGVNNAFQSAQEHRAKNTK